MAKSFPNTGATVIDATADLPGSPSEGMIVFQKDTNELKIYDGASWVSMLDTDTPPGLTLIYSNTVTVAGVGGTETFVNNVFSSAYDNYKILINIDTVSVGDQLRMRFQNSGTSSAASFYGSVPYIDSEGAAAWVVNNQVNEGHAIVGFPAGGSSRPDTTTIDVMSPFLARHTKIMGSMIQDSRYMRSVLSTHRVATSYSGLAFLGLTGATMVFKVRIYGYRNSI